MKHISDNGGMNKIKIGIMELYYHTRFLYTMCKICKRPYTDVTVFTTDKIWNDVTKHDIDSSEYNVVLKSPITSDKEFLDRISKACDNIDILFINTIREYSFLMEHYLKDYKNFNPKAKIILTLHNVNSWLGKDLHFNFSRPVHTIPYLILDSIISISYFKKYILPKIYAFNVVYPPMVQYTTSLVYDKPVFSFPYTFYKSSNTTKRKDNKIDFVIPGSIDKKRRDYHMVLNAFENFAEDAVALILLGRPVGKYGRSVVERCKKMKNVTFFEDWIPEKKYHSIMATCDFIISPMREKSCGPGVIEEIPGKSKASSPLVEAISYGLPLIIPSHYCIDSRLKTSTLIFSDVDTLKDVIHDIINKQELVENLKRVAKENAKSFSLPVLQSYFDEVIKEAMK